MFWISQAREGSAVVIVERVGRTRPARRCRETLWIGLSRFRSPARHKRQFYNFRLLEMSSAIFHAIGVFERAKAYAHRAHQVPLVLNGVPSLVYSVLERSRLGNVRKSCFEVDAALGRLVELYQTNGLIGRGASRAAATDF
jgi:hypothetical protein